MQILFQNANLVDIEKESVITADILVENGKIISLEKKTEFAGNKIDLKGNFVLPSFINVFCDSFFAAKNSFNIGINESDLDLRKDFADLLFVKNLLAGTIFVNDAAVKNSFNSKVLCDIDTLEESALNQISDDTSKNDNLLFMKVGQNLEELGSMDKAYQRPLSHTLEDFGFLDRRSVVVGGNCFEKDELQLFKDYDCSFALTPCDDSRMGRRPTNLITLKSLGFEVGIGSGQFFEIDFFAFVRQILMTQWGLFEDTKVISEKEVLNMAFFEGAKILGFENRIEKGSCANFIVIEKGSSLNKNPLKALVWEKSKRDVLMTVFKGEILQKNGEILMKNIRDYDTLISEIKQKLRRKQYDN